MLPKQSQYVINSQNPSFLVFWFQELVADARIVGTISSEHAIG